MNRQTRVEFSVIFCVVVILSIVNRFCWRRVPSHNSQAFETCESKRREKCTQQVAVVGVVLVAAGAAELRGPRAFSCIVTCNWRARQGLEALHEGVQAMCSIVLRPLN